MRGVHRHAGGGGRSCALSLFFGPSWLGARRWPAAGVGERAAAVGPARLQANALLALREAMAGVVRCRQTSQPAGSLLPPAAAAAVGRRWVRTRRHLQGAGRRQDPGHLGA